MSNPEGSPELERKLELVVRTGLLLSEAVDLKDIVQAATDAGLQLCGAEFGAFFYNVINAAGESYQLYTLSGVDPEKFSRFPMPRNTAVFAPTFGGTSIIRSDDITKDPRYGQNAPHRGMPEGHLPVRSYLAVPVKSRSGEILGGLFYGHKEIGIFEESSEKLVATVAAQAAAAIENHRLRELLTNKVNELEKKEKEQRQAAKHLGELAAIVESSDDAILSKDLNGIITSWNHAASRVFGYTSEEMVGKSILTLIPDDLQSDEPIIIGKIKSGQRIEHFETQRRTKTGELIDVSLTVSPVRDDTGEIVGASKIARDITSRKRMEESLLRSEKIAATGRMAATIAHEINNPLEAVMNLLYLLRPSITDEPGITYLATAENELTRVSHIAKQTLGYYREQASATSVSVSDLVENAILIYQPRCSAAGIKVEKALHPTPKIILRRGEIMQVISNLITNAIYAMPNGGTLCVSVRTENSSREGVVIDIEDNGEGIRPDDLPKIFEAFFTTRATIGTGIGLFVTRQFVEAHGGQISVQSSVDPQNHGTKVSVFLPLHTPYGSAIAQ